jgi:hypothetical protein
MNVQHFADWAMQHCNILCNLQLVAVLRSFKKCNAMQLHPMGELQCCTEAGAITC